MRRGRRIRKKEKRKILQRRRAWTRIERMRLIKSHIPRDTHPTSHRIPTAIALMLVTVSEKDTLNRLSGEFGAFVRSKKDKANTTKQPEHRIVRRAIIKTLKRNGTLESGRRLDINEIYRSRDSLSPKRRSSSHE